MFKSFFQSTKLATVLVTGFILFQLLNIDYGTEINNLAHVKEFMVNPNVSIGSGLERDNIAGYGAGESLHRWMTRFKLYSIEADEHINIMALSRIKPEEGKFDPHFYQYGGAWLYPLGVWYFILSKTNIITLGPLDLYLQSPDLIDAIYIWGRIFVLITVAISAIFLFFACRQFASNTESLLCLALFLCAPMTIMFSQVMKPHWYALLWVCICLSILARCTAQGFWRFRDTLGVGVCIGLAVGSVITFGLFALVLWLAMFFFSNKGLISRSSLLVVPIIAAFIYIITNPYLIINWNAFAGETDLVLNWFSGSNTFEAIPLFILNSIFPGFGIVTTLLLFALAIRVIVLGANQHSAWIVISGLVAIVLISIMTSSISTWHTNVRYLSWLLPSGLLFVCVVPFRGRKPLLILTIIATCLQSLPLTIAYRDENDKTVGTRYQAANWIEKNINYEQAICFGTRTPAPFDVPPINFLAHRVDESSCEVQIVVERQPDIISPANDKYIIARFKPQYLYPRFPFTFGHINPQISIYSIEKTN